MKTEDTKTDDQIVEEAADGLTAPVQEERDDWSPDDLNEEQRAEYKRGVGAVDEFLKDERTTQYEPTETNREKLLAYLEQHDLPLSFGGLYVAFEQLSEAGELELKEEQPDESEEPKEESAKPAEEAEPAPPTPQSPQKKRVMGWRNGKEVEVGA